MHTLLLFVIILHAFIVQLQYIILWTSRFSFKIHTNNMSTYDTSVRSGQQSLIFVPPSYFMLDAPLYHIFFVRDREGREIFNVSWTLKLYANIMKPLKINSIKKNIWCTINLAITFLNIYSCN